MKLDELNYVTTAEQVITRLTKKVDKRGFKEKLVTTSQIRNLLAMTADIYNEVVNNTDEKLSQEIIGRINYLKLRFIYEAGRSDAKNPGVKNLVEEGEILAHIDEINGSRKQYIIFSRYMEALVAYRKFLGDRDE